MCECGAMDTTVTRGTDRFEIQADGAPGGFAQFVDHEGSRVFFHTVIDPAFKGQGLGGALVARALEATREEGLRIVAVCPFVKGYVEKHPEWAEHVDAPTAATLGAVPRG